MKILNFGSLNLDYVYSVDHIVRAGETQASAGMNVFCGGKGLNQSIALAKAGVPVYQAGLVGEDGEILFETCKEAGVNAAYLRRVPGKSGHTIIQVDRSGQNCILLYSGANGCVTKEYVDEVLAHFEKGDMILLQNEVNLIGYIVNKAYETGMEVIMNPSPYNEKLKDCDFHKISMLLLNEIEGEQLTGEKNIEKMLERLGAEYPKTKIMLTLGDAGAVYQYQGEQYRQGIYTVDVVDTTAAGDTFTGYFIASMLEKYSVQEGMDLAAKASAIAVSRKGAAASIPVKEEVLSAML